MSVCKVILHFKRHMWCNGYLRTKWTQQLDFKSWTRLFAFHIVLIPIGKYESIYSLSPTINEIVG